MKELAVVIPAYNAQKTIRNVLTSISLQTIADKVKVYIANDNPEHKMGDYCLVGYNLEIEFIDCEVNGGPGIARDRGLNAVKEPFVTFIDADDILFTPIALEKLLNGFVNPNVIEVQSAFVSIVRNVPDQTGNVQPIALMPRNDVQHPWVFGRMYSTKFLKENKIGFDDLRAMEDAEFNMKIRLLIEGTQLQINILDDIAYLWNEGSEHSITRNIWSKRPNIPVYNYGACSVGSAIAFSRAIEFVAKVNPFNSAIARTAAEIMVERYFNYYEAKENYPEYGRANKYVACWWYDNVFKKYCSGVTDDTLEDIFMQKLQFHNLKHFPEMTFKDWFNEVKEYAPTIEQVLDDIPEDLKKQEALSGCTTEAALNIMLGE